MHLATDYGLNLRKLLMPLVMVFVFLGSKNFTPIIAEPTLETLKNLPGKVEHIITNLERHAKALEKDDSGSTEKKIKGILSKIS